jgi:hypothetical protein
LVASSKLPPASTCNTTAIGGIPYMKCGDTWFRPNGSGYIVVKPPY